MRILVFSWKDPSHPWAGGSEVYLHEIARQWVACGHSVTWFSSRHRGAKRDETVGDVNYVRRSFMPIVFVWAAIWYWLESERNYDFMIDCMNGIPFFTPLFSRVPKLLLVHHIHVPQFRTELRPMIAALAEFVETRLTPQIYRRVPWVTVSESSKEELRKIVSPDTAVSIVYNAVRGDLVPAVKAAAPTIAYVGRLKRYKRVDVLIRAFAELQEEFPSARLIIAGSGDATEELRSLAQSLGLVQVAFCGFVSERDKAAILGSAWVLAMPSLVEGWGLAVLEANACGTPAVAFNVPGLRDSIRGGQTGLLAGSTTEFRDLIAVVLRDHNLRARLCAGALAFASAFNWQQSARAMLSLVIAEMNRRRRTRGQSISVDDLQQIADGAFPSAESAEVAAVI